MASTEPNCVSYVISGVLLLCCHVHGKTYSLALLGLESRNERVQYSFRYDLMFINKHTVDIGVSINNVYGSMENLVLPAYGETKYTLDPEYSLNESELANKTIMISSPNDFTLQVFSRSVHHTEGFIALPLEDLLGPHTTPILYEYSVTTYCPDSGICQMAVSTFGDAMVNITFPGHLQDIVFCIGKTFFRSSRDSLLQLSEYDAVQIETAQDLTGTLISSNSPIAVHVGSRNLSNDGIVSHTLEQLPTISQWGTEYGVANVAQSELWDIIIVSARISRRTKVEMSGFGTFILDGQETLTRRLLRDEYTIIKADKPIQVVQVNGFVYNSSDTATVVSMAVVSAREHATDFTRVTCGSQSVQTELVVINGKRSLAPQANGMDMYLEVDVVYSDLRIYSNNGVGLVIHTVTGDNVSGTVHCGTGSLFPIGLTHTGIKQEEGETKLDEITGTCIEGETVEYRCDSKGSALQTIEDRYVADFFALKLRVKTCGNFALQFTLEGSLVVFIRLSSVSIGISLCNKNGLCNSTEVIKDIFNIGRSCRTDIAWYWFQETTINDFIQLRVGTGPVVPTTDAKIQPGTVVLPSRVKSFSLSGLFANATFNYDLEPASGCVVRVSDWRCEDLFQNCSLYGKTICKDIKYRDFSERICSRYCGKCKLDGFGRKFIVVIPPVKPQVHDSQIQATARIYIKPSKPSAFIGVATDRNILGMESLPNDALRFSYILQTETVFWIVSNVDLLVTVFIPVDNRNTSVAYNVFPTDTFAREYQTIEDNDTSVTSCHLVTDGTPTEVTMYFRGQTESNILGTLQDGSTFSVDSYSLTFIRGYKKKDAKEGILLKSNKPISVFCYASQMVSYYNQLLPLNILGIHYRIPRFDTTFQVSPTVLQLYVQGLHSYTTINLIGATMQTHILSSTGEKANFTLNPNFQYEVTSSQVISVGLRVTLEQSSTFLLIPPVECFSDDIDTAMPVDWTNTFINTVTSTGSTLSAYTSGTPHNGITTRWGNDSVFGIFVTQQSDVWSIVTSSFAFEEHDESNEICEITKAAVDDGVDNDCDGFADEEICCGQDTDLDGAEGEDYWVVTEELQEDVSEPECIPIDKPEDQCWTVCRCPCSWVENLLISSKLSRDEFLRLQQIKASVLQKKLRVNEKDLVKVTATKISAEDPRQSAANVGYVGVVLFMLAVAFIVFLDISSIKRDLKVLLGNLGDGSFRFIHWITCGRFKSQTNHS